MGDESNKSSNSTVKSRKKPNENDVSHEEHMRLLEMRREELEEQLSTTEQQIANLEVHYLEQTHTYGNALRGWEGLLNCRMPRPGMTQRRPRMTEVDRMFSLSSSTSPVVSVEMSTVFRKILNEICFSNFYRALKKSCDRYELISSCGNYISAFQVSKMTSVARRWRSAVLCRFQHIQHEPFLD